MLLFLMPQMWLFAQVRKMMLDEQVAALYTHTGAIVLTDKYIARATRGCCASPCVTLAIAKDKDPPIINNCTTQS